MKRSIHRLLCAVLGCILLLGVLAGANTAMAEAAASGKCGKDLVWSFDPETGVMTIEGKGAMWDYDSAKLLPWAAYASDIKKVVFKSGVTSVGKNAFSGCAVGEVEFADTTEAIGQNAFRNCENLAAVDLTNTKVRTIAAGAFVGCEKLTTEVVKLPDTVVSVSATAFEEKVEVKAEEVKSASVEVTVETTPDVTTKTWTEDWGNFRLEYTEMPDGTLITKCYSDGELKYSSVTTYGSNGQVREVYSYPDGSSIVNDWVEDADGNELSSVMMCYDAKGTLTQKTVKKTEDGVVFSSDYDGNGKLTKEEARVANSDGTYTETSMTYYDDNSTQNCETLLDANFQMLQQTFVLKTPDDRVQKGQRFTNVDGSLTEKGTTSVPGDEDVIASEWEHTYEKTGKLLSGKFVSKDTNGNVIMEKSSVGAWNSDGTFTETSTIKNESGKVTSKRTEDPNGNLVELSEITYDENGEGYEKVYDKDNNLIWEGAEGTRPAETAQTLELPQGMLVAVGPEEEPAKEQPTEEQPTEEQPTEEKPTEEKPTEEQPKSESEVAVLPAVGEKIAVVIAA